MPMKLLWKSLWVTNHVALTPLASSGASLGGWSLLFNSHSYAYKKVAQTGIKVRSAFLSSAPKSYFSKSFLAHYSFSSGEATVRKPIWKCVPWIFFPFNFSACKCSAGSVFFLPKDPWVAGSWVSKILGYYHVYGNTEEAVVKNASQNG